MIFGVPSFEERGPSLGQNDRVAQSHDRTVRDLFAEHRSVSEQAIEGVVDEYINIQVNSALTQQLLEPNYVRAMGNVQKRVPEYLAWGVYLL
ncbi:MAG: hypothetical protein WA871_07200 [Candidatus Acidiferrales bacterium]